MDTLTNNGDKVVGYRQIIQRVLQEYAGNRSPQPGIETETIFDTQHDHYEIMTVGWLREHRIHGSIVHLDIRGGKLWIQHDGTEVGIADLLVEAGVPRSDIVLAFQSPYKRRFSGFAVE